MKRKRGTAYLLAFLLGLLAMTALVPSLSLAQGCAMCQTTIGGATDPLAKGVNVSILFLMSMPFVLVLSVAGWFFYMHRKSRRAKPALRLVRAEYGGKP
jgi:heme/copper-type cytochrome/quinol oxidase subunit 2